MNYYNYFTEIEDEFVRRRGSHVLVSPLDWSLIETWRQLEIPLSIVLRGINAAFDSYDKLPKRGRKVNSLLYCQQGVEASFQQYRESQVGGGITSASASDAKGFDSQFGHEKVVTYLDERLASLKTKYDEYSASEALAQSLARAIARLEDLIGSLKASGASPDEQLEGALTRIEQLILDGLHASLSDDEKKAARREAQRQLKNYRDGMSPEMYEQTLQNFLAKRWRDQFQIPRLSLFYM